MNLTATILPVGHSEFEWAGITPAPSETIRVPRIAEAPIAYECKLQRIVTVSDQPGGGSAVFGEVQRIHIRDDIYQDGYVLLDKYKPIGRIGGAGYVRVTDTFEMQRVPPPDDK
jgi:flavin reductase (DIM6/NTAB) family NADH-FMN oxidoreductase RutF